MPALSQRLGAVVLVVLLLVSASTRAMPLFSDLIIFGDSLSDNGNVRLLLNNSGNPPNTPLPVPGNGFIPTAAPYDRGPVLLPALTNGPVWGEILAQALGLPPLRPSFAGGGNWAVGGASLSSTFDPFPFSVQTQVDQFITALGGGPAPADAQYVVWGGSNDARLAAGLALGGGDPTPIIQDYGAVLTSILNDLVQVGARNILVVNIPDLGLTPFAGTLGSAAAAGASALSAQFNNVFSGVLDFMDTQFATPALSDLDLKRLDIAALVQSVAANPGASGLSNVTDACAASLTCIANPGTHLFWDGIHPTAAGHAIIAGAAQATILVSAPGTLILVVLGIGVLGARRRG